ncbi:unnamed protein product [Macrosiphum euphorbiae]|uniref:Uncharacterized protein n=1 Tax=Macrosiphum euphorbiae TaxID=13131 RepID=A0AAV0XVD0_9HEMI|nr:unnamed protein product [Macrosiphum euphorbiae]
MTPLVPFTPRTRTQPRLTSTDSKCTTKKWKCDEEIGDGPVKRHRDGMARLHLAHATAQVPNAHRPSDQVLSENYVQPQMEKKARRRMHQTLIGAAARADVTFLIVTNLRFSLLDGAQPDVVLTTRSKAS